MLLLVISETNFEETNINIWFFLMIVCISFYYFLWIRYFVQGRTYSTAFKPLGYIPIPMAIFPVLAFGFAAIWGKSIWLGLSVIILAFGHITNSWIIYQYTKHNLKIYLNYHLPKFDAFIAYSILTFLERQLSNSIKKPS
jgi:hypothetical protein